MTSPPPRRSTDDARMPAAAGGAVGDARVAQVERWLVDLGDRLFAYARARVANRSSAEELVQETFLAALKNLEQYDERSQPATWLTAILRHKIHDHYRSERRRRGLDQAIRDGAVATEGVAGEAERPLRGEKTHGGDLPTNPQRWVSNPQKTLEMAEFWQVFDGCVQEMPDHFRAAFQLREVDDLPSEEVCKILEVTATNLSVRIHRARMLMRKCLEQRWFVRGED